ncbi:VWA-like domain-containing protein, partial [Oceaniglobus roseus]|uniref:VWA-like domain-containing protein n=1 Tax=Oceaniglobus roseus TaxID=1737570 RepID=UPI001FE39935
RRPRSAWVAMEAAARAANGPAPVFQPGLARALPRPRVAIGLDTSGSVDTHQLRLFAAEIAGIARRSGTELHLLAFDESVHLSRRLDPARLHATLTALDLRREGGTAFTDVLAEAARLRASLAVLLTDLDGPLPPRPALPVIWAVPRPVPPPPFGKVVTMDR